MLRKSFFFTFSEQTPIIAIIDNKGKNEGKNKKKGDQ